MDANIFSFGERILLGFDTRDVTVLCSVNHWRDIVYFVANCYALVKLIGTAKKHDFFPFKEQCTLDTRKNAFSQTVINEWKKVIATEIRPEMY